VQEKGGEKCERVVKRERDRGRESVRVIIGSVGHVKR
jgi:hypothetical protein